MPHSNTVNPVILNLRRLLAKEEKKVSELEAKLKNCEDTLVTVTVLCVLAHELVAELATSYNIPKELLDDLVKKKAGKLEGKGLMELYDQHIEKLIDTYPFSKSKSKPNKLTKSNKTKSSK